MSTFAKKVTSAVAGLAIVFSMVSPIAGVSAAYTGVDAANKLATLGVIVDQSANPADYRLGDNLPRKEAVKVMMNLSSISVVDNCNGDFSDLTSADWACKYAETALSNGMVAANSTFGPDRLLSNIEGLKMVFQGRDLERNDNSDWRAGYVDAAVEMGIANNFTNYDDAVTRGQFFIWAAEAIDAEVAEEDDLLCELLGDCPTDPVDPTDPTDPVVVDGDMLEVSLSPMTPASATIPGNVNGLAVAAFDFTAGSSDVTVSQVSVKRTGLSASTTLESLAIFSSEGRASNAKSDNQDNDTTAQINLDDGGVVVMAGMTETLVVVVDVADALTAGGDQFALEVVDVIANSPVSLGDVRANTMEVGAVDAPTLTFDPSGSVSDPTLGEEGADIFEFEIDNSSDEDVILRSLTFEGSSDAEDDLMNFELLMGNDVIATTTYMNGDYLTFDLGDGLTIEEDKTEDFTVRADVVEGAGDTIEFRIDEELDISADSTKFGYGASVDISNVDNFTDLGSLTIEAGELTFVEVDAANDEIREDKDNVELGSIKITNVSGQSLEMEEFGVNIAIDNNGVSALMGNGAGSLTVSQLFTDVELYSEDSGSSYELTETTVDTGTPTTSSNYSDNNIDVLLPEGTTTWIIRADTAEDIDGFDSTTIDISIDVTNDITVVETSDDEEVTDKTPSSLSFNSIDGSESGAQLSLYPLADTDVVRGSDDVVTLQFEVEAEEVSDIVVDEMTVYITGSGGSYNATNQEIADIKLYQGSISESNLLDEESGSDLGAGSVTFDRMPDVTVAANATETFIVTVSFVDGTDAVNNSPYVASLTALSIEDDENDDVDVSASLPLLSARDVNVNDAGTITTVALDSANVDNEFDKVALAGTSVVIASFDVRADNEEVDVETATFTIAGYAGTPFAFNGTVVNASLLLDGVVVATNSNSDISDTSIVFEDMTDLIIPETTSELALQLNTANIGEDQTGEALTGLQVTQLVLSDAEGVESGKDTSDGDSTVVASTLLDIVTAVITPSDVDAFGSDDKIAELRLVVDGGSNTDGSGDAVQAELIGLDIEVTSFSGTGGAITVINGNGATVGTAAVAGNGIVTVAITSDSIGGDDETYEIQTTAEAIYKLTTDGVNYSVNGVGSFTTKLENTLNLGEYSETN